MRKAEILDQNFLKKKREENGIKAKKAPILRKKRDRGSICDFLGVKKIIPLNFQRRLPQNFLLKTMHELPNARKGFELFTNGFFFLKKAGLIENHFLMQSLLGKRRKK